MLKRQDMESQKATAGAPWPHRTRTYIPFTSAMSPCPPASLSSRSSPWQSPRGSRLCSGIPSINSPLSRNENGCRASADGAVKRTFCFFCAHSKQSVGPSAENFFAGRIKKRHRTHHAAARKGQDGSNTQLSWTQEPSVTCAEVAKAWDQWHGLKWMLSRPDKHRWWRARWLLQPRPRGLRGRARYGSFALDLKGLVVMELGGYCLSLAQVSRSCVPCTEAVFPGHLNPHSHQMVAQASSCQVPPPTGWKEKQDELVRWQRGLQCSDSSFPKGPLLSREGEEEPTVGWLDVSHTPARLCAACTCPCAAETTATRTS